MSAGKVKMGREMDVPADAPWQMLFSRNIDFPNNGSTAIEMTAAGIAVHGETGEQSHIPIRRSRMRSERWTAISLDRELRCRRHCTPPINF